MSIALQPLLTTGVSGLVGTHFAKTYDSKYLIDNLDISHPSRPVDITNQVAVSEIIAASDADCLIHLAAFTDVTKAWEDRDNTAGITYRVNVEGTRNIVKACEQHQKHLILVSTAYVFDGEKSEPYTEADAPHPIEWYGQTKALAEEVVRTSAASWTILRIDQPFSSMMTPRPDLVRRIATGLQNNSLPPQFTNHTFGPTFIDDFSKVLDWVIQTKTTGLFHATSGETWTDYDFAIEVKNQLSLSGSVKPGDLQQYLAQLDRPYQKNTALNSTKLQALLPFSFCSITDAIAQVEL